MSIIVSGFRIKFRGRINGKNRQRHRCLSLKLKEWHDFPISRNFSVRKEKRESERKEKKGRKKRK